MDGLSTEAKEIAQAVLATLTPTLDAMNGRMDFISTKVAVVADQAETMNDRQEERLGAMKLLHTAQYTISQKLYDAAVKLATARALSMMLPTPARLAALTVGAALGGFLATWAWLNMHAPAFMHLPPESMATFR